MHGHRSSVPHVGPQCDAAELRSRALARLQRRPVHHEGRQAACRRALQRQSRSRTRGRRNARFARRGRADGHHHGLRAFPPLAQSHAPFQHLGRDQCVGDGRCRHDGPASQARRGAAEPCAGAGGGALCDAGDRQIWRAVGREEHGRGLHGAKRRAGGAPRGEGHDRSAPDPRPSVGPSIRLRSLPGLAGVVGTDRGAALHHDVARQDFCLHRHGAVRGRRGARCASASSRIGSIRSRRST